MCVGGNGMDFVEYVNLNHSYLQFSFSFPPFFSSLFNLRTAEPGFWEKKLWKSKIRREKMGEENSFKILSDETPIFKYLYVTSECSDRNIT